MINGECEDCVPNCPSICERYGNKRDLWAGRLSSLTNVRDTRKDVASGFYIVGFSCAIMVVLLSLSSHFNLVPILAMVTAACAIGFFVYSRLAKIANKQRTELRKMGWEHWDPKVGFNG